MKKLLLTILVLKTFLFGDILFGMEKKEDLHKEMRDKVWFIVFDFYKESDLIRSSLINKDFKQQVKNYLQSKSRRHLEFKTSFDFYDRSYKKKSTNMINQLENTLNVTVLIKCGDCLFEVAPSEGINLKTELKKTKRKQHNRKIKQNWKKVSEFIRGIVEVGGAILTGAALVSISQVSASSGCGEADSQTTINPEDFDTKDFDLENEYLDGLDLGEDSDCYYSDSEEEDF